MNALEYMEKQVQKHQLNYIRGYERKIPEEDLDNIRRKIEYYQLAVEALKKVEGKVE